MEQSAVDVLIRLHGFFGKLAKALAAAGKPN
jgi:hypothetical protein